MLASMANGLFAGGDIFCFFLIRRSSPPGVLRIRDGPTWWKV